MESTISQNLLLTVPLAAAFGKAAGSMFPIVVVSELTMALQLLAAVVIGVYSHLAKAYDLTKLGDMPERTIVMDYKGEVLGRMHGENRIIVPLSEVSRMYLRLVPSSWIEASVWSKPLRSKKPRWE